MRISEMIWAVYATVVSIVFFGMLIFVGGALEDQARCDNGATEYCIKE